MKALKLVAMTVVFGVAAAMNVDAATISPGFTAGSTGGTVAVVDQNTGAITWCSSSYSNLVPIGTCFKIGTAVPTTTGPSLVISYGNGDSFFVTNIYTGKVVQCIPFVKSDGTDGGSCIAEGTAS